MGNIFVGPRSEVSMPNIEAFSSLHETIKLLFNFSN